ncbi:unnamed protein product [Candidula unifasciata]|uniref:G-protein coupled receptors family 1 profile domain-containing protein n=1 Tax=Candidula unifasciata TaxID=100452 RepID=A0A8S3ZX72_9EUPU|nr:unnamed protein product [Candidula unifasciata]
MWVLGQCVTILGLIVNALNIVVFVRQGLQDSVNISLLGLSISDFGSLFFLLLVNLFWTPIIMQMDLSFYPSQIAYVFIWTHIVFTRVSTGITAWITFERCLCIVAPLKIKSIITPRRTMACIAVIYVIMIASIAPVFYGVRAVWKFDTLRNKSVVVIVKIPESVQIERGTFWINNILPTIFLIFIITCAIVLVKALNRTAKWRETSTSLHNREDNLKQVGKLVLIISIVFIACYSPGTIVFMFVLIFPDFGYTRKQKNLLVAVFSFIFQLGAINATINFFVYLTVSSKFKRTFEQLFCVYCSKRKPNCAKEKT